MSNTYAYGHLYLKYWGLKIAKNYMNMKLQGILHSIWFTSMQKNISFHLPEKCNYFCERKMKFKPMKLPELYRSLLFNL